MYISIISNGKYDPHLYLYINKMMQKQQQQTFWRSGKCLFPLPAACAALGLFYIPRCSIVFHTDWQTLQGSYGGESSVPCVRDHPTGGTLTQELQLVPVLPELVVNGSSGLLPCPPSVDPVFGIRSLLRTKRTLVTQLSTTSSAQERQQIQSCQLTAKDSPVLWTQSHRCCLPRGCSQANPGTTLDGQGWDSDI